MLQHSKMKNHTLSAKPKKKGTVYSRKVQVRTSNDSETMKGKPMAYVQTTTRWYNTPLLCNWDKLTKNKNKQEDYKQQTYVTVQTKTL